MIFNNLGDILYTINALESTNTSISIINSNHDIIYESSRKDYRFHATAKDLKKILNTLHQSKRATFKVMIIDYWITAITTIPIWIDGETYLMEFKQFISKISQMSSDSHKLDQLSIHQIKEMAITDALTKLYNRRYIDERFPIDMQSSFELDKPISVLFIDIDYFKSINDKYGHAAGDQILQELAILLQKQFNKGKGWVARYGGDEILICLPGYGKKSSKRIANKLIKTIEGNYFNIKDQEISITCSIGLQTVLSNSNINSTSELIAMADRNLYQAKKEGRNRVV